MNLELGAGVVDVVGKLMQVLYDEGGPSPVPYAGLVVYVEPARVYVVFDGFDEAEGAWVDDSDDWTWSDDPEVKMPVPAAASPAWSENQPAGLVDKIYLHRSNEEGQPITFFVKWKEAAHLHSQWVPVAALEAEPANKQRVQRYLKVPTCTTYTWPLHHAYVPRVHRAWARRRACTRLEVAVHPNLAVYTPQGARRGRGGGRLRADVAQHDLSRPGAQQPVRPPTAPQAHPLGQRCPLGPREAPSPRGCQREAATALWCPPKKSPRPPSVRPRV